MWLWQGEEEQRQQRGAAQPQLPPNLSRNSDLGKEGGGEKSSWVPPVFLLVCYASDAEAFLISAGK